MCYIFGRIDKEFLKHRIRSDRRDIETIGIVIFHVSY
jgi:hypothetical protein